MIFALQGVGTIYQAMPSGYSDGWKARIVNAIGRHAAVLAEHTPFALLRGQKTADACSQAEQAVLLAHQEGKSSGFSTRAVVQQSRCSDAFAIPFKSVWATLRDSHAGPVATTYSMWLRRIWLADWVAV